MCRGPGCEAEYPAGRLALLRGEELVPGAELGAVSDASAVWQGVIDGGADWVVDALPAYTEGDVDPIVQPGRIVIGQPEADAVVMVADSDTFDELTPLLRWSQADTQFGTDIAVAPRQDDPSRFDLVVGAPGWSLGRGAVYLFLDAGEQATTDTSFPNITIEGSTVEDRLGSVVRLCSDLTGDGFPEILVTAPWFLEPDSWPIDVGNDPIDPLAGAVFLLESEAVRSHDADTALPWELGRVWWGDQMGANAGHDARCDADLTGDGVSDLIIGAPFHADDERGRVYILSGGELPDSGPLKRAAWHFLKSPTLDAWFGMAVAPIDADGEPPMDLAVGAPGWPDGRGRVLVYAGADIQAEIRQGTSAKPLVTFVTDSFNPVHFGRELDVGDVDGDLRDDLMIGAPDWLEGRNGYDTGRAWIWFGNGRDRWSGNLSDTDADVTLLGADPFDRVGGSLKLRDVDADGLDDALLPTRTAIE